MNRPLISLEMPDFVGADTFAKVEGNKDEVKRSDKSSHRGLGRRHVHRGMPGIWENPLFCVTNWELGLIRQRRNRQCHRKEIDQKKRGSRSGERGNEAHAIDNG